MSKHLGSVDPVYASLFLHDSWRELLEKAEPGKSDVSEIVSRISKYLECSTDSLVHLPVAEAMVTYKEKRSEETSQGRLISARFQGVAYSCYLIYSGFERGMGNAA